MPPVLLRRGVPTPPAYGFQPRLPKRRRVQVLFRIGAGSNPLPIVIPCHRVIGANGKLTGYGGGLPIKERLLALERGGLW